MLSRIVQADCRAVFAALALVAPTALSGCLGSDAPDDEWRRRPFAPAAGDFLAPKPREDENRNASASQNGGIPDDPSPDPRLNLSRPWSRGDRWYYESNESNFLRVTVSGVRKFGGVPHYVMKTEKGLIGYSATDTTWSVITRDFLMINSSLEDGFTEYDPPHPGLRFLPRYGKYEYNETGFQRIGGRDVGWQRNVRVLVTEAWPLYPVKVPAGKFLASEFAVYTSVTTKGDKAGTRLVVNERWYAPEVGNDVMLKMNVNAKKQESYQLAYFVHGGKRVGLSPTELDYEK